MNPMSRIITARLILTMTGQTGKKMTMGVRTGYYYTSIPRPELCHEAQQPLQMPDGFWSRPSLMLSGCEYGGLSTGTILLRHQCNVTEAAYLFCLNCWVGVWCWLAFVMPIYLRRSLVRYCYRLILGKAATKGLVSAHDGSKH